ncbi:hypothetical protein AB0M43_39115 [Longispora sp. NPDC051575]|uniref:hypothetical protein n=1 Tax=Longispora sp. NPDC051575 TaxID=3154943 RepID=UPI003446B631
MNKLDLYWAEADAAKSYYNLGSGSEFSQVAGEMLTQLGTQTLRVRVLPMTAGPFGYTFQSNRGPLQASISLDQQQCSASLGCVIETLEELCDV